MARPNYGWGSPLLSQDIIDNYPDTHHEVDGLMILNDEDYLNSLYDEDNSISDGIVKMSNHYLAYDENYISPDNLDDEDEDFDWGYPKDEDGFYILPDDGDYEMSYQNNLSYEDTTEFENYFDRDLDDLDDDYDDEEIF